MTEDGHTAEELAIMIYQATVSSLCSNEYSEKIRNHWGQVWATEEKKSISNHPFMDALKWAKLNFSWRAENTKTLAQYLTRYLWQNGHKSSREDDPSAILIALILEFAGSRPHDKKHTQYIAGNKDIWIKINLESESKSKDRNFYKKFFVFGESYCEKSLTVKEYSRGDEKIIGISPEMEDVIYVNDEADIGNAKKQYAAYHGAYKFLINCVKTMNMGVAEKDAESLLEEFFRIISGLASYDDEPPLEEDLTHLTTSINTTDDGAPETLDALLRTGSFGNDTVQGDTVPDSGNHYQPLINIQLENILDRLFNNVSLSSAIDKAFGKGTNFEAGKYTSPTLLGNALIDLWKNYKEEEDRVRVTGFELRFLNEPWTKTLYDSQTASELQVKRFFCWLDLVIYAALDNHTRDENIARLIAIDGLPLDLLLHVHTYSSEYYDYDRDCVIADFPKSNLSIDDVNSKYKVSDSDLNSIGYATEHSKRQRSFFVRAKCAAIFRDNSDVVYKLADPNVFTRIKRQYQKVCSHVINELALHSIDIGYVMFSKEETVKLIQNAGWDNEH